MAQRIVDVLVPVALDHTYSYRGPPELDLGVGDLVAVPLGKAETVGVVWADNVPVQPGLKSRLRQARRGILPCRNVASVTIARSAVGCHCSDKRG